MIRKSRPSGRRFIQALAVTMLVAPAIASSVADGWEGALPTTATSVASLGKVDQPLFATVDEASSPSVGVGSGQSMNEEMLPCVAFGPYVGDLDPDYGPHPSPGQIDELLDALVSQTSFRCIMTYGVLNGLDYTFRAAQERGIKVIAIIWLGTDEEVNDASITLGIEAAKAYPSTIIRLSCGSEFRSRNGPGYDDIIRGCITRLRAEGVAQPITSIDTWWEWCAQSWPCQQWDLAADVDWIGINVFPWWENKFSGLFPCTPAADAAEFHIARLLDVSARYPDKDVILTEFGWPAGPDGYTETNQYTGQQCGIASEENQRLVLQETVAKLNQLGRPGVLFEAFREGEWKMRGEGPVGMFWGMCSGSTPYACTSVPTGPVGGEAELPSVEGNSETASEPSGPDAGVLAGVIAGLAASALTVAGVALYGRKWRQRR